MSATESTKMKSTEHMVVPFVLPGIKSPATKPPSVDNPPTSASPESAGDSTEKEASPLAVAKTTPSFEGVAVLALGESGEILAARDACLLVFGWEPPALVGQNIRILLKGGLDNDVGRFLHRHRAGKNPTGTISLRVWGVRKDGIEFPAQVTTLTWNWDTAVTTKGDVSKLCWTAAFQDLSAAGKSATQAAKDLRPLDEGVAEQTAPHLSEPTATPAAAQASASPPLAQTEGSDMAAEQVAVFELKQRVRELEDQLARTANELAGSRAGAEKSGSHESELQSQLASAKEAAARAETALREETECRERLEERLQALSSSLKQEQAERSKRFEAELISLRQERDELNARLAAEQRGATESTRSAEELEARLIRNEAEFQRAKAELEKQTAERQQSESSWRQQLDTVWIAKKEVEGAFAGAVERNKHFEEELAKLRREHDELKEKLAAEQKSAEDAKQRAQEVAGRLSRNAASSDRARAELEKENAERERADSEWRQQLEAAKALKTKLEASLTEAANHHKRLEEEVTALRKERDELQKRTRSEQQMVEETSRRAGELQRRMNQDSTELERLAAELKKQTVERERAESRAREQQETAKASARKLEADWAGAVERNVQFEEELVELRRSREELALQLKAEHQSSSDAQHLAADLERRLERSANELKRAMAESETLRAERERADSESREQLEAAKALARKLDAAWTGATERNRRLEAEAVDLRQEREELLGKLAAAHREAAESTTRITELENQIHRMSTEGRPTGTAAENRPAEQESLNSAPHASSGAQTSALRRDLNQHNGHATKPEGLPADASGSQARTTGQSSQTKAALGAPGHPVEVEPYNFDFSAGRPARRDAAPSKKRLQP
jgi:hypothetical protein